MSENEQIHILIVEDTLTQFLMMQHLLESHGYKVSNAKHGLKAIEFLATTIPAAILSDVNMPEMDGYELCQKLKSDVRTKDIPFVLLSSFHDPAEIVRIINCGADNFMLKRFDEGYFLARLKTVLAGRAHVQPDGKSPAFMLENGTTAHIEGREAQLVNMLISAFGTAMHLVSLLDEND